MDQLTKHAVRTYLKSKTVSIIKNILELTYLENRGAVWGSFQNQTAIFLVLTVVFSALILFAYSKLPETKKMAPLGYLMIFILTGAVGNFIDRAVFGFVTDFIYFKLIDFPVFNVADIFVTCATFTAAFMLLFYYKDDEFEWLKLNRNKKADENGDE